MTKRTTPWRHVFSIVVCGTLAVVAGLIYLSNTETVYEAESRLLIETFANRTNQPGVLTEDREFMATQAELIGSPLIIGEALQNVSIAVPKDFPGDSISYALQQLTVAPVIHTDVLSIGFRSYSADEAESFINALVASYKKHLKQTETSSNSETLEILTHRGQELREELESLNRQHLALRQNSQLVGQSRDVVNVHSTMLNELAQKLTETRLKKIELASRLESLLTKPDKDNALTYTIPAAMRTSNIPDTGQQVEPSMLVDNSRVDQHNDLVLANLFRDQNDMGAKNLADLESQMLTAKLRFQQLNEKFGERHIETRLSQAEVSKWEQLFEDRLIANTEAVRRQHERLNKAEADLESLYAEEHRKVKELDTFLIQDEQLRSQIERTELMFGTILDRLSELQLTGQALQNGQSSVVVRDLQDSHIYAEKIWPQPKSFLAVCLAVGLVGGFLLTFGFDALRAQQARI